MMKARAHGADKYSPLVNGAPYSTPGKITEFNGDDSSGGGGSGGSGNLLDTGGSGGSGGSGQAGGFNQKDHYGHKDPLGNLYHVDMQKKTLNIDWTKLSEVIIKSPKVSWDIQDTKHDRTKGWGESGGPTQIQGDQGGSGSGSGSSRAGSSGGGGSSEMPPEGTDTVSGDLTWTVAGSNTKTVQKTQTNNIKGDQTNNYSAAHSETISGAVTQDYGSTMNRKVKNGVTMSGGERSDSYGGSWSASAKTTVWPWVIALSDTDG
jgi:hypothetical protein